LKKQPLLIAVICFIIGIFFQDFFNLEKDSKLNRTEMMQYFDSLEIFRNYHQSNIEYNFLDLE